MAKEETQNILGIVRIAGKDLDGNLPIPRGLTEIKGIGMQTAQIISVLFENETGISRGEKIGRIGDKVPVLERIIKQLDTKVPSFILNRRRDLTTGKDLHIVASDLDFKVREDIKTMQKTSSYKGIRHSLGLTVRGQKTRSGGRKNRKISVRRKKK